MNRHEFGGKSLGADIRWIATYSYLRMLHHLSCVQALYEQETAIHVSEPSQALAMYHNLRWRRSSRPCCMIVPSLGSRSGTIASALCLHQSVRLGLNAVGDCVLLQLLMEWVPCMRPRHWRFVCPTRRLPNLHCCRPSASLARPGGCVRTAASDNLPRIVLFVSVWTSEPLSVSASICSIPWLRIASQFCLWPRSSLERTGTDTF